MNVELAIIAAFVLIIGGLMMDLFVIFMGAVLVVIALVWDSPQIKSNIRNIANKNFEEVKRDEKEKTNEKGI